ncbi:MAG: hypothetical protein OZ922_11390 [Myxococcales bacterium]|jgi:hypothetical protein|nr:hypothetical protein [Myxococcales bacterium]
MSEENAQTFGREMLREIPDATCRRESAAGHSGQFEAVEKLVWSIVDRAFKAQAVLTITCTKVTEEVQLTDVLADDRAVLATHFAASSQQSHGAWYIPKRENVRPGTVLFPYYWRLDRRHAWGNAVHAFVRPWLEKSADALFVWATLEPFFERVFEPFALRGHRAGQLTVEDERVAWDSNAEYLASLGIDCSKQLAELRPGATWVRLPIEEQLARKGRLLDTLISQSSLDTIRRHRVVCIKELAQRYYEKSGRKPALRKTVLTKPFQPTLSAWFAGDWLRFLRYIGEEPHADEKITTALPHVRPFASGRTRAKDVAQRTGIDIEEIDRMLATYWNQTDTVSPIDRRVQVLQRYWQVFDEIHARQQSGSPSLWGLVEEGGFVELDDAGPREARQSGSYRKLLPSDLVADIDKLWESIVEPRWPERIVSEPFPHAQMAKAFGAALQMWHGCALTAWFVCEGPYSRTGLDGLAEYHARDLTILKDLKCPVDESLFSDLVAAESKLGPPQPIYEDQSRSEVLPGIAITTSISYGSRRDGFEFLRDVINQHRREWAGRYLDEYLHLRWDSEIRDVADKYNRHIADKGNPPTPKRCVINAAEAANHWFAGDFTMVYAVLREKAPPKPTRVCLMPQDRRGFVRAVFFALGGEPFERKVVVASREEGAVQAQAQTRHHQLTRLAQESLGYIQIEEALGRAPTMEEFGESLFRRNAEHVASEVGDAWDRYVAAIETAKRSPFPPAQHPKGSGTIQTTVVEQIADPIAHGHNTPPQQSPKSTTVERRSWMQRLMDRMR